MARGRENPMSWVQIVALMLTPAAAFWAAGRAWEALGRVDSPRWWPPPDPVPQPRGPAIERLGADLHRLSAEICRIERSDAPAKVARMRAAALAYDDVLLEACRALDVPAPVPRAPLGPLERLEAEAALAREGLVW
jgi:hypothetical protein